MKADDHLSPAPTSRPRSRWILLAGLGLAALAAGVVIVRIPVLEGSFLVGRRLYMAQIFGLSLGLLAILLYSRRKDDQLARVVAPAPTQFTLTEEERAILAILAAEPFSLAEAQVATSAGLSGNKFRYHWHRLHTELRLVECEERLYGADLYVLSQSGRKYALEHRML